MHILSVACIDHFNRVTLNRVGVVPFAGVCHVVARPSAEGRLAASQCALYGVDGEESIVYVALHVLIRIGVAVFFGHVLVERPYLGCGLFGEEFM